VQWHSDLKVPFPVWTVNKWFYFQKAHTFYRRFGFKSMLVTYPNRNSLVGLWKASFQDLARIPVFQPRVVTTCTGLEVELALSRSTFLQSAWHSCPEGNLLSEGGRVRFPARFFSSYCVYSRWGSYQAALVAI
jgi:hypothetical protein